MQLHIFKDRQQLFLSLAGYFADKAREAISERGKFVVALSGGTEPRAVYELLSREFKKRIAWDKVYFFLGDERHVPQTDIRSNFRMARESLLQPLAIAADRIYRVNTDLDPEEAAMDYQAAIDHVLGTPARFDLVLLGLGDDGHTASLFPYSDRLTDKAPAVRFAYLQEQDMFRITFNAPLINHARNIAFLVFGREKAAAVAHILNGAPNVMLYPAQLIRREGAHWFLDEDAAAALPKPV